MASGGEPGMFRQLRHALQAFFSLQKHTEKTMANLLNSKDSANPAMSFNHCFPTHHTKS
jgi:hypothetical protein